MNKLNAWSYSRYSQYKRCPFKAKCIYVDKLPMPESPAMNRGLEIHSMFENFLVNKKSKISPKFSFMRKIINDFRNFEAKAEEEIAYTRLWQLTGWFDKDAWLRVKTDVGFFLEDSWRIAVDYKTGKEWDDHRDQSDLYALSEFQRFEPQKVDVRFIYVDIPKTVTYEYDISEFDMLKKIWNTRGEKMTRDKVFKPRPGGHCRRCTFSKHVNGPCKY